MTSTLLSLTSPDNAWMVGGATLALVATAAAYLGGGGQSEEEKDVVAERTGNAATLLQSANLKPDEIEGAIAQYEKRFEGARTGKTSTKESIEKRKADYQDLVNQVRLGVFTGSWYLSRR